jgi:hypothetical protein
VTEGKVESNGRDKVSLMCEIADDGPEFGKRVWVTITQIPKGEKGHGIMIHNLHAFGIGLDGNYEFDPVSDLQGKQARALLGVEPYVKVKDGRTYNNERNFVEELYTEGHPEPATLPAAPAAKTTTPAAKPGPQPSAAVRKVFAKRPEQEEVPF